MKIDKVKIRNYRSIINEVELSFNENLTCLVGENNSGKSNVLRAINLALNEITDYENYTRENDYPQISHYTQGFHGKPEITIQIEFLMDPKNALEKRMLKHASNYEVELTGASAHASQNRISYYVGYTPNGARYEQIISKAGKKAPNQAAREQLGKFVALLKRRFKFIYIPSSRDTKVTLEKYLRKELVATLFDKGQKTPQEKTDIDDILKQVESLYETVDQKILMQASQTILANLKTEFPILDQLSMRNQTSTSQYPVNEIEFYLKDEFLTKLANKGSGVQSIILIALLHFLFEKNSSEVVIGLEEPEAFLHPKAQQTLLTSLEKFSKRQQFIYTTHSPLMISRTGFVYVASKEAKQNSQGGAFHTTKFDRDSHGDDYKSSLLALYDDNIGHILGVFLNDKLKEFGEKNFIFEGESDLRLIEIAYEKFKEAKKSELFDRKRLKLILPITEKHGVAGVGKTIILMSFGKTLGKKVTAILDDDIPGQNLGDSLSKLGFNKSKDYIFYSSKRKKKSDFPEIEIEDLLSDEILKKFYDAHRESVDKFLEKGTVVSISVKSGQHGNGKYHKEIFCNFIAENATLADLEELVNFIGQTLKP